MADTETNREVEREVTRVMISKSLLCYYKLRFRLQCTELEEKMYFLLFLW